MLLANDVVVRGVQFSLIDAPDEIRLNPGLGCTVAPRAAALTCAANQVGNEIRVVLLATGGGGIPPGTGQIATVYLDETGIPCTLGSEVSIAFAQTAVADAVGDPVPHTVTHGTLRCGCVGDLDATEGTDLFDALACVDFIIGRRTPTAVEQQLAELQCNGAIDVFDCLRIVDTILGRLPACPVPCAVATPTPTRTPPHAPPAVSIGAVRGAPGTQVTLPFSLTMNSYQVVTIAPLVIGFDPGIASFNACVSKVSLQGRRCGRADR